MRGRPKQPLRGWPRNSRRNLRESPWLRYPHRRWHPGIGGRQGTRMRRRWCCRQLPSGWSQRLRSGKRRSISRGGSSDGRAPARRLRPRLPSPTCRAASPCRGCLRHRASRGLPRPCRARSSPRPRRNRCWPWRCSSKLPMPRRRSRRRHRRRPSKCPCRRRPWSRGPSLRRRASPQRRRLLQRWLPQSNCQSRQKRCPRQRRPRNRCNRRQRRPGSPCRLNLLLCRRASNWRRRARQTLQSQRATGMRRLPSRPAMKPSHGKVLQRLLLPARSARARQRLSVSTERQCRRPGKRRQRQRAANQWQHRWSSAARRLDGPRATGTTPSAKSFVSMRPPAVAVGSRRR